MTIDKLRKLAAKGDITPEHSILIEGGQTWHSASIIHGLVTKQQYPTPTNDDIQPDTQQNTLDSVKNAGKNIHGQVTNKLPFVKSKLLTYNSIIMQSKKNMIITGSSVVAFLLILLIAFGGGGGVQGHLNAVKNVTSQMIGAINSGDAEELLDSLEEAVYVFEAMQKDSATIKSELASMNEFEKQALMNEFMLVMQQNQSALTPSDDTAMKLFTEIATNPVHLQRMQALQSRMELATRSNPFESIVN